MPARGNGFGPRLSFSEESAIGGEAILRGVKTRETRFLYRPTIRNEPGAPTKTTAVFMTELKKSDYFHDGRNNGFQQQRQLYKQPGTVVRFPNGENSAVHVYTYSACGHYYYPRNAAGSRKFTSTGTVFNEKKVKCAPIYFTYARYRVSPTEVYAKRYLSCSQG